MLKSREFLRGKIRGRVGGGNKFTFSPAASKQISVAFGNKVMDTRLPQPSGCGDKYDVSDFGYILLRRYTPRNDVSSVGRSMIEMLGVLAIIAILSVGGIAGYSKAMRMWKMNKTIGEYSMLFAGVLEHLESLKSEEQTKQIPLADTVQAMGMLPDSYTKSGIVFYDTFGNIVYPYAKAGRVAVSIKIGGFTQNAEKVTTTEGFAEDFCLELFRNIAQPLQSEIYAARFWQNPNNTFFYGAKYCQDGEKCLPAATLKDFQAVCSSCDKKNTDCDVSFEFK